VHSPTRVPKNMSPHFASSLPRYHLPSHSHPSHIRTHARALLPVHTSGTLNIRGGSEYCIIEYGAACSLLDAGAKPSVFAELSVWLPLRRFFPARSFRSRDYFSSVRRRLHGAAPYLHLLERGVRVVPNTGTSAARLERGVRVVRCYYLSVFT
jgi:hypothetical protein